jgi:hypothetical protein
LSSTIDPNEKGRGRRDRRVVLAEDITDEELALIEAAEVPAELAHLNAELDDIDR